MTKPSRSLEEELAARECYLEWKLRKLPRLCELQNRLATDETFDDVVKATALASVRKIK